MGKTCTPISSYTLENTIYAETFQTQRVVTDCVAVMGVSVLILLRWQRRCRTDCRRILGISRY